MVSPYSAMPGIRSSMVNAVCGATEPPSPVSSVVIPWVILLRTCGSTRTVISDWPSRSMKPGATTSPLASMVRRARAFGRVPTAAIRSPRIARSPLNQGLPEPSTIRPPRRMMS